MAAEKDEKQRDFYRLIEVRTKLVELSLAKLQKRLPKEEVIKLLQDIAIDLAIKIGV